MAHAMGSVRTHHLQRKQLARGIPTSTLQKVVDGGDCWFDEDTEHWMHRLEDVVCVTAMGDDGEQVGITAWVDDGTTCKSCDARADICRRCFCLTCCHGCYGGCRHDETKMEHDSRARQIMSENKAITLHAIKAKACGARRSTIRIFRT